MPVVLTEEVCYVSVAFQAPDRALEIMQISNILIIKEAMREASFLFAELASLGAPMRFFDCGGGLAIDYEVLSPSESEPPQCSQLEPLRRDAREDALVPLLCVSGEGLTSRLEHNSSHQCSLVYWRRCTHFSSQKCSIRITRSRNCYLITITEGTCI